MRNTDEIPFSSKIKLECECSACQAKYEITYYEDEVTEEISRCPFCGEPLEESTEVNPVAEEESSTYRGDDGAIVEEKYDYDDDEDSEEEE